MNSKIDWTNLDITEEWFEERVKALTPELLARLIQLRGFPSAKVPVVETVTGGFGWDAGAKSWVIPLRNIYGDIHMAKLWRPTTNHRGWIHAGAGRAKNRQKDGPIGDILDLGWIAERLGNMTERKWLWITGGEWDTIMLRCYDWLATTSLHGEGSKPTASRLLREFGGKANVGLLLDHLIGIAVCLDADAPGQTGAVQHVDAFEKMVREAGSDIPVKAIDLQRIVGWKEAGQISGWDVGDLLKWSHKTGVRVAGALLDAANNGPSGVEAARELLGVSDKVTSTIQLDDTMRPGVHMIDEETLIRLGISYAKAKGGSRAQGAWHLGYVARKKSWLFPEWVAVEGHVKYANACLIEIPKEHAFTSDDAYKQMARGFLHIGGKENLCDDIANAIRYAHLFPFLKYDERGGKEGWRYWDGVRWRDGNAEAVDHAMRVSDYISEEAAQIASDNEITSKQLFRWAKQSRMNGKIMAILNIAQKSTVCRLSADTGEAWDEKGYHLGMSTGVFEIDGRGKVTGQEARDLYVSMSTRGNILTDDEGSLRWGDKWNRCREFWFTLLSQWQPGADRVEVISMLQEIAGMSLRGRLDEAVFVLQGSGRSGKSALLDGLSHTLGDYAYEVSGDVFVRGTKSGGGASSNMRDASKFQMDKKRMIKITEVGGRQLDVDMLKQATGETTITGRALYAQPSTATMHGTFWMMTNQELDLRGDASEALRGRLWLIEFPTTFVHESRLSEDAYRSGVADGTVLAARDDIKDRLRGLEPSFEAMPDVILTWAYEGLVRVIKRGSLSIARSVRERTSAMWSTTDLLGTYWNESGLWMPGGVTAVTTRGLYNNIKSWAEREDPDLLERIAGVQQLGDYLKTRAALGFNRHRTTKALWSNGNQLEGWDVPYTWQQIREV